MEPTRVLPLLFAVAALGADFSGSWKLRVAESDFGQARPPESLVMRVAQSGESLEVESDLVDARGPSSSRYKLDLTGREASNEMRGNRVLSTSSWRGGTLHVKARTTVQGTEIKTVDQWQLDADGKRLTIYRTATTPRGDIEQRFVYEKSLGKP